MHRNPLTSSLAGANKANRLWYLQQPLFALGRNGASASAVHDTRPLHVTGAAPPRLDPHPRSIAATRPCPQATHGPLYLAAHPARSGQASCLGPHRRRHSTVVSRHVFHFCQSRRGRTPRHVQVVWPVRAERRGDRLGQRASSGRSVSWNGSARTTGGGRGVRRSTTLRARGETACFRPGIACANGRTESVSGRQLCSARMSSGCSVGGARRTPTRQLHRSSDVTRPPRAGHEAESAEGGHRHQVIVLLELHVQCNRYIHCFYDLCLTSTFARWPACPCTP